MVRICLTCKKEFKTYPSRTNRRYCSRFCKNPNQLINCLRCGKKIRVPEWEVRAKRQYCSQNCKNPSIYKSCLTCNKIFKISPSREEKLMHCSRQCRDSHIYKKCLSCCRTFKVNPSAVDTAKYCSANCYHIGKITRVKLTCPLCLKEFYAYPSEIEKRHRTTCSRYCSDKFYVSTKHELREHIRRLWLYSEWKRKVKERDNFTCQICNAKPNSKRQIHADHIEPFTLMLHKYNINTVGEARGCKELWDTNNGRTLCVSCHIQTPTWGANARYQLPTML